MHKLYCLFNKLRCGGIIDDNSIIASQTVVLSSSPHSANCIMAGIPATITKRDITWCRKRI